MKKGTISGDRLCPVLIVTILYVPREYFSETHQVDIVRFVGVLIYATILAWAGIRFFLRRRRGPAQ